MERKVSIIIPVFNTEKYLNRCLESIVRQTYSYLEILIIDDGSYKECRELCDQWAKRDQRVKVIHKQNQGLGYARNTGIEHATGEFLFFIDSDDYLDKKTVESCMECEKQTGAEIICYGFSAVNRQGKVVAERIPDIDKNVYEGEEIRTILLPEMIGDDTETGKSANIEMSAWAAMFSAEVIQRTNWKFVSEREIISEDVYSLLQLYRYVNKVAILKKKFYFYCQNEESLTHVYREDRYSKIKHFYKESIRLSENLGYGIEVRRRLKHLYIAYVIGDGKTIVNSSMTYFEKIKQLKKIIQDDQLQHILDETKDYKMNRNKRFFLRMMMEKKYTICFWLLWLQCHKN